MIYKVTSTAPDTQKDQLRREAARRVYEELLKYITAARKTA